MNNTKDNIIQEQETEELLYNVMSRVNSIPKDKYVAQNVIKFTLQDSDSGWPWAVGQDINLNDALVGETYNKLRFFEYGLTFIKNKSNRGNNFEGLLAGLCNGEVISDGNKPKEDIVVSSEEGGTKFYSVKMGEGDKAQWDTGSVVKGLKAAILARLDDLNDERIKQGEEKIEYNNTQEIKVLRELLPEEEQDYFYEPIRLLRAPSDEYSGYAEKMLTTSFVTSNNQPLSWIFGAIKQVGKGVVITYQTMSSAQLIGEMLVKRKLNNQGRTYGKDGNTGVRLIPKWLGGPKVNIIFPIVEDTEIEELMYRKEGDREIDLVARIFPGSEHKVHHDILNYIKKDPKTFLQNVQALTNRLVTKEEITELYNLLTEGVGGDQEKHTGEQGDLFTMDGSENLGVTDMFVDDGFDLVHKHGNVHLSDLSPEESETAIPAGSKKVKKQVLKPRLDKGPFNSPVTEDFQIDPEKGHYGYIFSDKLPIDVDNKLYVLSNKLGDLTHEEISKFADKAAEQEIHVLQGLLYKFPSTLQEMVYYYGGLDTLRKSVEYQRIINIIRSVGDRDYLTEDIDVFGQGLGEPIDPEEFEGDDEEWEELVSDVEDEDFEVEPEYEYTGGKTDPSKGFVAPSSEVTNNICNVEGFCDAQGPITFGQLRKLVEEATKKRIKGDMGRGLFKTLWRIIPFFIPQVLLAAVGITVTRAINKIVTPALTDTRGYKSWWGKAVLKAMDVAEGDYIPDVAIGDDPLSKIFFISDGLLQMIRDKYKLKFARYVAEVASNEPDDKPVPEWFVENLLRDYLNQKFLLDPPLPIKKDVEKTELEEMDIDDRHPERDGQGEGKSKTDSSTFEQPGDDFTKPLGKHRTARHREFVPEPSHHSKGGVVETDLSKTAEKLYIDGESRLQNAINQYMDGEYEIYVIDYPGGNYATRFKSYRTGEVLKPQQVIGEMNKLFGGGSTNGILNYLKYLVYKKQQGEDVSFLVEDRTPNYPGSPDSFRSLHRDRVNDDKLQIPPATLVSYLDKYHREKLIKELTPALECIAYNCYEGWKNDSDNLNPDNSMEVADQYCDECGEGLLDTLGLLDREIVKMGFVKTGANEFEFTGVPRERRVNDYPIVDVLEKPFPFTYNDWLENIIQEVDPKFFINKKDDIVYMEETTETINEQNNAKDHNPDVEVGDVIELIYMDDPWADIGPMTRGVVMGFESMGSMGEKVLVKWIMSAEEGNEKFRNLPLIKDVDYWRKVNPLSEHIISNDEEDPTDFDYERFGNLMVRAHFNYSGGWGQPPKRFVVYITPSGIVKGVSLNVGMSNRDVPFKEGDKVSLGDLIRFEKNSKFDLQMKGRIREEVIKEQTENYDLGKMTPALWKVLKMVDKLLNGTWNVDGSGFNTQYYNVLTKYFDMGSKADELYLILRYNSDDIHNLITTADWKDIKIPNIWETEIEYYDSEASETQEDECIDQGGGQAYTEHMDTECECRTYEDGHVTRKDKDGDEYDEYVNCREMSDDEREEAFGIDDEDECPCEDWYEEEYTMYWNPIFRKTILSTKPLLEIMGEERWDHLSIEDVNQHIGGTVIETENDEWDDNYDEAQSWDYYSDQSGEILDTHDEYENEGAVLMDDINSYFYKTPKNLQEQEGEQLKMFTTGQWHFPVSGLEKTDMKYVEHALPEHIVTKIFKRWDEKGIDFSILKMLGIDKGFALLQTMLLKRYLQFTNTSIPVSHTLDCTELKELFNTNSQDYEMEYVEEYLCGEDSFWDNEDWYNYEWESYMTDAIDEKNWKTIRQIFGGVSQSVAEDILTRSSSSEEVDELTDKYDEEIDEIQNFIVWANSDETEYATKSAMAKDIREKIEDHFDGTGRLMRDDYGKFSYIIDGDLKDYVNDKWDNTEDVFEYHQDYMNQTLEDVILDLGKDYMKPDVIFQLLMDEEYRFWDYCEGKKGDCLETEQKFFEGYWMPDIDINESLTDRLGELTYEPEEVSEPIQEQQGQGADWVTPNDVPQKDAAATGPKLDDTPFTPLDVKILNRLATMFERAVLNNIWKEDESMLPESLYSKYENLMKLYGEKSKSEWSFARSTRFAKWADDNWDEAERIKEIGLGDDYDPTITYDLDFGLVTNPIKEWPHEYEIAATESYWAKEYRYGSTIVPAYGEENAEHRADTAWWEWDVDMEYGDQGDTDDHELEVDTVSYHSTIKEARMEGLLYHTGMLREMDFDRENILKLAKNTKGGLGGGRTEVFRFLENLRESGLVNMFQATDFLWSGKDWLIKYLDFKHPERLEDPDENIQYLLDNANRMRDILVILLMDRADREGKTPDLDNMNREIRPLAQDLVKIWSIQL